MTSKQEFDMTMTRRRLFASFAASAAVAVLGLPVVRSLVPSSVRRSLTAIVAVTLRDRAGVLADNVVDNAPLLKRLRARRGAST